MPEMDGLALCRKIRKLPRDNYTYLVLLGFWGILKRVMSK
jgi:CheY-like chemotaxis protein